MQLLAFALTFMESWEVMAMNMGATFYNGGASSLAWGILLVVIGALAQSLSMAELASIQPIAGAQYHWTSMLAPADYKRFITWMQGWITWFAWISALGGSTSSEANILLGLVTTNYPDTYVYKPWHLTMVIIAQLFVVGLINMYAFRVVPYMELGAGILHVILFFIFMIVLLATSPKPFSSASFVFTNTQVNSGWSSQYVSWNLGLLVPAWGFIGFDGVNHMSEEVRKAKHAVPRVMVYSILMNGVLAYAIILVLLFVIGDQTDVLDSYYPIIPLCLNAAGQRGGTAMVVGLLIVTFFVVAASLASVSRITWAWARDGGLPKWFAQIHPVYRVPIRSLLLPIVIVTLLSLFAVGNTATTTVFSAFTALSSLGLYSSYIIAISCILHARLTGRLGDTPHHAVQFGEWRLPRGFGIPINIYALVWTMYLTVWLPFPTTIPVTGTGMNYAGPIFGFVVLAALGWWWVYGRRKWEGLDRGAIENVVNEK
jgi:choline transport protein